MLSTAAVSYSATMVFLVRSRSAASIGRWLAQRLRGARTVTTADVVGVRWQGGEVRVTLE